MRWRLLWLLVVTSGGCSGKDQRPPEGARSWPMPNSIGLGLPNEFAYSVQGTADEPVVSDDVTGLAWQQAISAERFDFDAAPEHCSSSHYAGFSDWRLPTRIELVSLLDLSRTNPALLSSAFPSAPSDWYWTSTPDAADPTRGWYVYFYFGYPDVDDRSVQNLVRCVRQNRADLANIDRYEILPEWVHDTSSGLTWQREASTHAVTFTEAAAYCAGLRVGDAANCRVPTMKELQTLVDERRFDPALDSDVFLATQSDRFWSSSAWSGTGNLAWYVRFDSGSALYDLADTRLRVRCVR